jgi:hypothetical protein
MPLHEGHYENSALPSAATLGGHQDAHHILVAPPLWALPTTYT